MSEQVRQILDEFLSEDNMVKEQDGSQYVVMKPTVEAMGLIWENERQRLLRDPLFTPEIAIVKAKAKDGREHEMTGLSIRKFPMWLYMTRADSVTNLEKKVALTEFQSIAGKVLGENLFNIIEGGSK